MATAYEADITDLVKPYMEKARKEGELKGELKSKLETARKMMEFGDTLEKIILITGLSEAQLKKNDLLQNWDLSPITQRLVGIFMIIYLLVESIFLKKISTYCITIPNPQNSNQQSHESEVYPVFCLTLT